MRMLGFFAALGVFASSAFASGPMSPGDVIATFRRYESLHRALLSSVGSDVEASRRSASETFARGPFNGALDSAEAIVCASGDREIIQALFHVALVTSGSAFESTSWTLGRVFTCNPDRMATEFCKLPASERLSLYGELCFGFENVVYDRKDEASVRALRKRLHTLAPADTVQ